MDTNQLIQVITERIVNRFSPEQIVLFGSYAGGKANSHSDIDLLIVLRRVDDKRKMAIEVRRTLKDLPVAKDIIVTSPEEIALRGKLVGNILHSALREGRIIYERTGAD